MKKVILFDFDGTLADTFEALVNITNKLAEEYGYPPVNQSEINQFQNLSSWQIIKKSGISIFQIPLLLRRIRSELHNQLEDIDIFPGIKEALLQLKSNDYSLYILTSNSTENVTMFMQNNHILDLFSGVYSSSNLFGKHRKIRAILKQEKIKPNQAIYVGDETRDIMAARKANIKAIAVSWGFNNSEVLSYHHPDALIHYPNQLAGVVKEQLAEKEKSKSKLTPFPKLIFNSLRD